MADGGSITVTYKADIQPLMLAVDHVKRQVASSAADMAARTTRAAAAFGIAGLAANRLGANLAELGNKSSAAGRAGGFLAQITSGNVVGAVKAAGQATQLTGTQVEGLTSAWFTNTKEVYAAIDAYKQIGAISQETADKITAARTQIAAGYALAYSTFGPGTANSSPDNRADPRGAAAIARSNFLVDNRKPIIPSGLPLNIQVALEGARASGQKTAIIKQIQRAEGVLSKQLRNEKLTDEGRLLIYQEINSLNSELESLTRKSAVAKKTQVKSERDQLVQVQKGLVGSLGQGPFLTSPLFQYAQSYGYKAKPMDYLKDLKQQVAGATRFSRNLDVIGRKGGSTSLVGELAGLGAQGQDLAAALTKSPGLIKSYSSLADKRAAVAEKLQVQSMTATIGTAQIVVRNGRVAGVDRNGNGKLEKEERFAVMHGGRG